MKNIAVLALVALSALMMVSAAWAGELQLPEKEIKGIKTLAGVYFPSKRVNFYKNRVFIRDNAGYLLTFKVTDQRKVEKEIDGRPGYEAVSAFFLISVSDYLQHPERGPLGFGGNVVVGKIGGEQ